MTEQLARRFNVGVLDYLSGEVMSDVVRHESVFGESAVRNVEFFANLFESPVIEFNRLSVVSGLEVQLQKATGTVGEQSEIIPKQTRIIEYQSDQYNKVYSNWSLTITELNELKVKISA